MLRYTFFAFLTLFSFNGIFPQPGENDSIDKVTLYRSSVFGILKQAIEGKPINRDQTRILCQYGFLNRSCDNIMSKKDKTETLVIALKHPDIRTSINEILQTDYQLQAHSLSNAEVIHIIAVLSFQSLLKKNVGSVSLSDMHHLHEQHNQLAWSDQVIKERTEQLLKELNNNVATYGTLYYGRRCNPTTKLPITDITL